MKLSRMPRVFMIENRITSPAGPLRFRLKGHIQKALSRTAKGDIVALYTTNEGDLHQRFFSLVQVGNEPFFSETDEYRYHLPIERAWLIPGGLPVKQVILRPLTGVPDMDQRNQLAGFVGSEPESFSGLDLIEIPVDNLRTPDTKAEVRATRKLKHKAFRNAPPPQTTRKGVMRMRREQAATYCFRIEGASSPAFKIGWAFDVHRRQADFNRYSLHEIGGLKYVLFESEIWGTAKLAYRMEQQLLRELHQFRLTGNTEVVVNVAEADLRAVWEQVQDIVARGAER